MANGAKQLPDGWKLSTLDEASTIILGQSPSSETYNTNGNGLPFYQGKTEFGDLYPTTVKWCSKPNKIAEAGDILISVRAPVGPTNLCQEKSAIGRGLAALRPKNDMPSKYLLYYLRLIENEWDSKATGTTFKAITGDVLRNQEIPIAPLPEQERIVAKIEELFTQLEAGTSALERVQVGLRRYKASVLKAACEGRLLDSETVENGELPERWSWATLESIALKRKHAISSGPFGSALGRKDYQESGIPDLRGQNIKNGNFNLDNLVYVSEKKAQELVRSTASPGDLVVVAVGSSGQPAIVPDRLPKAILSQNCNKITIDNNVALSSYALIVMQTDFAKNQLAEKTTDTARPFLSLTNLKKTIIPLPPLEEQRGIVAEVERRLSVAREVESVVEKALVRAARLRQSVLRSAFEGRL